MARIRTNTEIEGRYRVRTRTEVVDMALRRMATEPMTWEEALTMQGSHSIGEVPPDRPPRESRNEFAHLP